MTRTSFVVVLSLCATLPAGCGDREPPPPCAPAAPAPSDLPVRSVVLILMDDVGVDKVAAYGVHPRPPATPNLDELAGRGLRFVSAYAEPICTAGRAALLTGRRPIRTGLGSNIRDDTPDLSDDEVLIPEALREATSASWTSAMIGKWHLSHIDGDALTAPLRQGFDHFDGLLANPNVALTDTGNDRSYWLWERVVDGDAALTEEYLLTAQADAAIQAVNTLSEPFFLYVAFSGAHVPLHVPPEELWSEADLIGEPGVGDAMVEALDHEIGRLVDAIGDRATVIVTSDNGTSTHLVRPPARADQAKGSVYSGGVHVPLIVVGPDVVPGTSRELVHVTDLFPTVLDLAGVDPASLGIELDGTTLVPLFDGREREPRRCVLVENFVPNGVPSEHESISVMDDRFSLVRNPHQRDELFRRGPLAPAEGPDLLRGPGPLGDDAGAALRDLQDVLRFDL